MRLRIGAFGDTPSPSINSFVTILGAGGVSSTGGVLGRPIPGNDGCDGVADARALRSGIRASRSVSCVSSGVDSMVSSGSCGLVSCCSCGFVSCCSCGRIPANASAARRIRCDSRLVGLARSPFAMLRRDSSLEKRFSRLT